MISCLVVLSVSLPGSTLVSDLEAAGLRVVGAVPRGGLVQEAVRLAPDAVIFQEAALDDDAFARLTLLQAAAPRPVVVFTSDPDVDRMAQALASGVNAYEVNGYAPARLRSVIKLAQLRFDETQRLRGELADVLARFEERKLVDRAKGILMRARQVSEDDAFRILRAASMHSNQRVGQVSHQVITAATDAEALNRTGQLRMLSQRLVKLRALRADALQAESADRVDASLAWLAKTLSRSTYGDLLDAVAEPWRALKAALMADVTPVALSQADADAERMLLHADRLVSSLEAGTLYGRLHVINVAGRQRMLSQRVAKQALLATLLHGDPAAAARFEMERTRGEFAEAMSYLRGVPLSTRELAGDLEVAERVWATMTQALDRVGTRAGQQALGENSEALLALFEQLTERYERSMQILMG